MPVPSARLPSARPSGRMSRRVYDIAFTCPAGGGFNAAEAAEKLRHPRLLTWDPGSRAPMAVLTWVPLVTEDEGN